MRYLLALFALLIAANAHAVDHYVSTTGSAEWASCTTAGTPCSWSTATANAAAGDTVFFADGTYNVGVQTVDYRTPRLNPANSGTNGNPIIFKATNPLGAVLNGTGYGSTPIANIIGSASRSYITWDGFKLTADYSAQIFIYNATGVKVQNCELVGATQNNGGNNVAGIRLETTTSTSIINNYIHGYNDDDANHNTAGMMTQASTSAIVEYNTFSNNTVNIYSKYVSTNDTYRYNLLLTPTSTSGGNIFIQNYGGATAGMAIHNNIIVGGFTGIQGDISQVTGNSLDIYNNTIYAPTGTTGGPGGGVVINSGSESNTVAWNLWNNIIVGTATHGKVVWNYAASNPTFIDYNDYYQASGTPGWAARAYATSCTATTLANWQTNCSYDANSNQTNPGFVNAGGTTAADYKRSSYPADGRGDAYATVIGAYTTGTEQIGYEFDGVGDQIKPITSLSTTSKLSAKASVTLTANESATLYACTAPTDTCTPAEITAPITVYPGSYLRFYSIDTATNEETLRSQYFGWPTHCR